MNRRITRRHRRVVIRPFTYEAHVQSDGLCAVRPCRAAREIFMWQLEVAAAFMIDLQVLEIALRDVMNARLAQTFGRGDWWASPRVTLHYGTQSKLDMAVAEIKKRRRPDHKDDSVTPEEIVEQLSLGFWVTLLGPGGRANYHNMLWAPALSREFDSPDRERATVHEPMERLRLFRNDVTHPKRASVRTVAELTARHEDIFTVLSWITPAEDLEYFRSRDRVPEIVRAYPGGCDGLCLPQQRDGRQES